jgi:hypothetical protein
LAALPLKLDYLLQSLRELKDRTRVFLYKTNDRKEKKVDSREEKKERREIGHTKIKEAKTI